MRQAPSAQDQTGIRRQMSFPQFWFGALAVFLTLGIADEVPIFIATVIDRIFSDYTAIRLLRSQKVRLQALFNVSTCWLFCVLSSSALLGNFVSVPFFPRQKTMIMRLGATEGGIRNTDLHVECPPFEQLLQQAFFRSRRSMLLRILR